MRLSKATGRQLGRLSTLGTPQEIIERCNSQVEFFHRWLNPIGFPRVKFLGSPRQLPKCHPQALPLMAVEARQGMDLLHQSFQSVGTSQAVYIFAEVMPSYCDSEVDKLRSSNTLLTTVFRSWTGRIGHTAPIGREFTVMHQIFGIRQYTEWYAATRARVTS